MLKGKQKVHMVSIVAHNIVTHLHLFSEKELSDKIKQIKQYICNLKNMLEDLEPGQAC